MTGRDVEKDDAYWAEVEQAVGKGTWCILFGTSTRSLKKHLRKLREATGRDRPATPGQDDRPA